MHEARNIFVTLTRSEFVALQGCVTGELESLQPQDVASGVFDGLDAAQAALNRAWRRAQRRAERDAAIMAGRRWEP